MKRILAVAVLVAAATALALGQMGDEGKGNGKRKASFTTIDFPGAVLTRVWGVNDKGRVVGQYRDRDGNIHGFLLGHRAFTTIDVPGAIATRARGINNREDIVGWYTDSSGTWYGFLLSKGIVTTLSVPGSVATFAYTLNNNGDIGGFYSNDGRVLSGIPIPQWHVHRRCPAGRHQFVRRLTDEVVHFWF